MKRKEFLQHLKKHGTFTSQKMQSMTTVETVLTEFSKLPAFEQLSFLNKAVAKSLDRNHRLRLIRAILDSMEEEDDFELSDDQLAALDKRWTEIENGTAILLSGEEVQSKINERYGWNLALPH